MKRITDIEGAAQKADEVGMRAIVHKDHHYSSAPLAQYIKNTKFSDSALQIFGSIALNNSVGGVRPIVAEVAANFGAKVMWLPTASAANHLEHMKEHFGFPTLSNGNILQEDPITYTDGSGVIRDNFVETLKKINEYPNVAVGSGHGNPAEIEALVNKCHELGMIDRLFIDHPTEILGANMDDMLRWSKKGAFIEFVAAMSMGEKTSLPIPQLVDYIKTIGSECVIIGSDLGMFIKGPPIEGYGEFLFQLYKEGLPEDEVRLISADNPAKLLGL